MTGVGTEIETPCPGCRATTTHVIVAHVAGKIAKVECRRCGKAHPFEGPNAAPARKVAPPPPARERDDAKERERGRIADAALARRLARCFHELGAPTREAIESLARANADFAFHSAEPLRYRIAAMTTFLVFQHDTLFIKLAEQSRRNKHLHSLYTSLRADVVGELEAPTREGETWALWRTPSALVICLEADDRIVQPGHAIALWLLSWTEDELPDLGDDPSHWLIRRRT